MKWQADLLLASAGLAFGISLIAGHQFLLAQFSDVSFVYAAFMLVLLLSGALGVYFGGVIADKGLELKKMFPVILAIGLLSGVNGGAAPIILEMASELIPGQKIAIGLCAWMMGGLLFMGLWALLAYSCKSAVTHLDKAGSQIGKCLGKYLFSAVIGILVALNATVDANGLCFGVLLMMLMVAGSMFIESEQDE